jgi:hypothetical protein
VSARGAKAKAKPRTVAQQAADRRRSGCTWCGHGKARHAAGGGCMGGTGPGVSCGCDEYSRAKLPSGDL